MWPYSEIEARWLSAENTEPEEITPEMLDAYLRRAHRLRSEIMLHYLRALPQAISRMIQAGLRAYRARGSVGIAILKNGNAP